MNMRYLRISGVLQRKGRGLIIVPTKRILAEKLAKSTASLQSIMEQYKLLCTGAPLPTDNMDVAKSLLDDLVRQMKERHILFDISDLPLNTPTEVNIARQRLENILAQTDEIQYASDQCNQWEEIRDYMTLLIKGGGKMVYDEDNAIEVPKDETLRILNGHFGVQHWRLITWSISLMKSVGSNWILTSCRFPLQVEEKATCTVSLMTLPS